jgi:acetyltransferase-like isoleucine patch superfamily enzyme
VARSLFGRSALVLGSLAPSGPRRLVTRRRMRARHGLSGLGEDFGYQIGADVTFGESCRLGGPVYVASSSIGRFTYVEVGCRISHARVGSFCSIAPYSLIGLAEHPTQMVSTHPLFYRHIPSLGYDLVESDLVSEMNPVVLGSDVWVGAGAVVRGGIEVGTGAVIGAGAVVTADVPPYAVVGGVPARLIRYRFSEATIEALLATRWWERDVEWLRRNVDRMRDADQFVAP